MKAYRLFFILPLVLLLACKGEVVEEVAETFPDGSPRLIRYYEVKGEVRDKIKEIEYYPNHKLFVEGEYKDNKRDGDWVVYYDNGNTWSEGSFKNGLNHGKRTTYYENGEKHTEGRYENGKMVGIWTFYNETGKQVNEIDYDKK